LKNRATKRITIIRHGKPQAHHEYPLFKILKGSEIETYIHAWNTCELSPENEIPEKLKTVVAEADIFISSKLKRTIDSFRLLGVKEFSSLELLNEAELPSGFLKRLKMPFIFWGILIRLSWRAGLKINSESYKEFKVRIQKAAVHLEAISKDSMHIIVMGHGVVNWQLKKELTKRKWKRVFNCGGRSYWSFDTYEKTVSS
jgi:broad specificity phosphatase PhoE